MRNLYEATQTLKAIVSSQHNRLLRMSFPHKDAPDAFMVANRLDASEGLSRDFHFTVEVLSSDAKIALKDMMGKMVTLELVREDGTLRYFNGYVFEFRHVKTDGSFAYYDMVLLPWLAFLRLSKDNYLFHGKSLEEQTSIIFDDYLARDWQTSDLGPSEPMTDACQFDETDYNYLHRRWEAQGWHYWYEHRKDGHTLHLSGDTTRCVPIDGVCTIPWQSAAGSQDDDGIASLTPVRHLATSTVTASSFDFKSPRPRVVNVQTINQQGNVPQTEIYEYAGAYGFPTQAAGDTYVRQRMEQIEAAAKSFLATGNDRYTQAGRWFRLTGHYDANVLGNDNVEQEFLILNVKHEVYNNYEQASGAPAIYHNEFTCLRKKIPWRPGVGYNSSEPKIYGMQTAIVTGPGGEEIHTDEYGRVRVQFHWDRVGSYDEKSSAWIRVASAWSGSNFGMTSIPRIGTEVIVQFLDGNPDRPLITGMVPNANTKPAWDLPANKTQSGILSRSTPGGSYSNANALRFEDKKGQEQLWLHAEKDQLTEVEHDEDKWVGNDRRKTVDRDETNHIKRDRTETVDRDETITVHGKRTESVDGNENITIHSNRTERVDHNEHISIGDNRREDVGQNETIHIGKNRTETVAQNESISIGKNRSKNVDNNESDKISKNWSIKVGKMKTETIGMANIENIGLARMTNIGMAYSLIVGMMRNTAIGMVDRLTVGKSRTVSIGETQEVTIGKTETRKVGQTQITSVGEHLELVCGAAKIVLRSDGSIYLQGTNIEIQGSAQINADSGLIQLNCAASKAAPAAPGPKQESAAAAASGDGAASSMAAGLNQLMEGGKSAFATLNQLKGLAQTAQAVKSGDIGAIVGVASSVAGGVSAMLGGTPAIKDAPVGISDSPYKKF